jgi:hypothetical protein
VQCGEFDLYRLSDPPGCTLQYCGEDNVATLGDSLYSGFQPPSHRRSDLAIGGPYYRYGFAWYLSDGGETCDDVCEDLWGSNFAYEADDEFVDACYSAAASSNITHWFYQTDNPAGWTGTGGTTGHTLGYGYDGANYYGKCASGTGTSIGTYPGETNGSANRNIVCPCFAMAGGPLNFKALFTNGVAPSAAVEAAWTAFKERLGAAQTGGRVFDRVTLRGSEDMVGKTCTGSAANDLAAALAAGTSLTVVCDSEDWAASATTYTTIAVGGVGTGCPSPAYYIRPDIGSANWGGINGVTCSAPTQIMEVVFD